MENLNLNQLLTIIKALSLYQDHLEAQLESMSSDEDDYGITADEMVYVRDLLPKIEKLHETMFEEKYGEKPSS